MGVLQRGDLSVCRDINGVSGRSSDTVQGRGRDNLAKGRIVDCTGIDSSSAETDECCRMKPAFPRSAFSPWREKTFRDSEKACRAGQPRRSEIHWSRNPRHPAIWYSQREIDSRSLGGVMNRTVRRRATRWRELRRKFPRPAPKSREKARETAQAEVSRTSYCQPVGNPATLSKFAAGS